MSGTAVADPPPPLVTLTCLSVRQPYADQIVSGRKPIENRTWSTPFRGRLYVHASTREPDPEDEDFYDGSSPSPSAVAKGDKAKALWFPSPESPGCRLQRHIVGSVELVDVVSVDVVSEIVIALWCPSDDGGGGDSETTSREQCAEVCHSGHGISRSRFDKIWTVIERSGEFDVCASLVGPHCWIVDDPRPLATPIPVSGRLRLWTFDATAAQLG
ncbi:MAG: ASCH domain-containing protein [Planctomycetota bacterium]|nr:ASCH domain-containing protein [Planctomycetota bacterium]